MTNLTRRDLLARMATLAAGTMLAHCGLAAATMPTPGGDPRLRSRPAGPVLTPQTGLQPLDLAPGRDGLLYVPPTYRPDVPLPLVVLLHGAGRGAGELMDPHQREAEALGLDLVLLAPDSRAATWDAIYTGFGPDVQYLDAALAYTFERCAIDPARIVIAGFSDGASYALGLGRANGDLAAKTVAYAPGMLMDVESHGHPRFFVTHGTADSILPVENTRQIIVPGLRNAGYDVEYREWDGGHGVSIALLREVITWMAA